MYSFQELVFLHIKAKVKDIDFSPLTFDYSAKLSYNKE